jgi:hypothetical protein
MMFLPLTDYGAREFSMNTGADLLTFRVYYSAGQRNLWLMDIADADGNALLTGLALVPGNTNLLKGHGDKLADYVLYCHLDPGVDPGRDDAPGKYLQLLLYGPGEDSPFVLDDPLMYIGRNIDVGS